MSTQDVVSGNTEYNKVTKQGETAFNQNAGGRNVWDWQDIPNQLQDKKGPAWQAIDALHADAIKKNQAIADLSVKVDHLTALLESHVAGLIEQIKPATPQ